MHVGRQPVANAHSHTHIHSQNTLSAAGAGILSHQKWRLRPDSTKSRGQPLDRFPIPNQRLKQDRVTDNPPSFSSSNCAPSVLVLPLPQPCPPTCDAHYFSCSFHPFIPSPTAPFLLSIACSSTIPLFQCQAVFSLHPSFPALLSTLSVLLLFYHL